MFVCLGNICRSPIAEAILNQQIADKGLSNQLAAESAGTAGYHIGKSPDHRAIEVLEKHNIGTAHEGRKLSEQDLKVFDHIVVMDEENFEFVHNMYHKAFGMPPSAEKLFLIRDYDPEVRGVHEVPDPYYGTKTDFENVFEILSRSNESFLEHLIEKYDLQSDEESGESTSE